MLLTLSLFSVFLHVFVYGSAAIIKLIFSDYFFTAASARVEKLSR